MSTKKIILIDGSAYFYRAFHGLPPLTTSAGQPTGAIHGVINMLRKIIREQQPSYLAFVFDAKGKTFRDELYSDYKANRAPMPDELKSQLLPLQQIIKLMGCAVISIPGVEADDVIGTLATQAAKQDFQVIISTSDKDMAQLVNEDIIMINTMSDQVLDIAGVIDKFQVPPGLIIDYLTLVGDKVDNIPGVPGCGPKTAVKWLQQYNDLAGICEHAAEITGKIGEKLRNHLPQLPLCKQLVTIKTDVELTITVEDLALQQPDITALIDVVKPLELNSLLQELTQHARTTRNIDYTIVDNNTKFNTLIHKLIAATEYVIDTETTSLDHINAQLVGLAFAIGDENFYVPLNHEEPTPQLSLTTVLAQIQPILLNPDKVLIGHNLKYDLNILQNYQLACNNQLFDTMLASYVLNSSVPQHDLDTLALQLLNHNTIKFTDIAGKGKNQLTCQQIPVAVVAEYAAEDAAITMRLYNLFQEKFLVQQWALQICKNIEFPVLKILAGVEKAGVLINAELLLSQSKVLATQIDSLEQRAFKLVGEQFNLSSPKQLQHILYEQLQLPIIKKTPKGQPSTAEDALSELALEYELPAILMEYRQLSKLKSTYTDALPLQINKKTNRIHTSYNQAVTSTGRLSSTDPNLQNIPIRTPAGKQIRAAFIAPKDHVLLMADYSQVELRIMAHLSQDQGLLTAFANNLDVHSVTASEIFNVALSSVTTEQRRKAKAINFGLIYGMSEFGLAKQLNILRYEAKDYIEAYFARYPKVQEYIDCTKELAKEQGYVESLFGRRLYLPNIKSSNYQVRMAAERAAINAPVQGSAADIIKLAMIKIATAIHEQQLPAQMIMQVHDELVFEVANNSIITMQTLVNEYMQKAAELAVPLLVDITIGNSWYSDK